MKRWYDFPEFGGYLGNVGLEYLMTHQDTVLSRGIIMEHVWGMDADPFSNAIEAHIASLRRKINSKRKNKLIHTYSGRGYKFALRPF